MAGRRLQARDLLLSVDRSRPATLGRQIEEQLRASIREGTLATGSPLPSTRVLAEDLSVSRGVVVRAYGMLAAEGFIELRQGAPPSVRRIPVGTALVERQKQERKLRFDLRPHVPDVSLFPRHAWLSSQRRALLDAKDAELGYIDTSGLERLRVELAGYLGRARGVVADPDQIVITAGSTHSLSLISRALAQAGVEEIGLENPCHWLWQEVVERAGLRPVGIPVDRHGLVVDGIGASRLGAVMTAPAHQFPTGSALAGSRRTALLEWALENDVVIIEDEYDAEFRYDRPPMRALQGRAPEQTIYLGSTSKTLAPGIRLGWAVMPRHLFQAVAEELSLSVLQISTFEQLAFADFLHRGEFDRHLRTMRARYRRRRDVLVEALHAHLPGRLVTGIAAGLHVVLELERDEIEKSICVLAQERGIAVESLGRHSLPGYDGPAGLLIGYGGIAEPAISSAIGELAQVLEAARPSASVAA
jgi:GntR family transcriptional regulator/MocR family aminotransferase